MRHTLTIVAAAVLFPAAAIAQTHATKPPVAHTQVVSTNPFGALFQWYNAEYERKVSPAATVGVSGSYLADFEVGAAAAFARWYPQRDALDGFYLGARVGAYRMTIYEYEYQAPPPRPVNQTNPTSPTQPTYPNYPTYRERTRILPAAGFEIGYNRLLGEKQNVSIGVGLGLMRTIGHAIGYDIPPVLPSLRLVNIGIAF
jgi:hypothetical protein